MPTVNKAAENNMLQHQGIHTDQDQVQTPLQPSSMRTHSNVLCSSERQSLDCREPAGGLTLLTSIRSNPAVSLSAEVSELFRNTSRLNNNAIQIKTYRKP